MSKVELISKTTGIGKYKDLNSEEVIAAIARHGVIKEDNGKLVKYLMYSKHWSPLDMINFTFEIETSRDIGRQILRHQSIKFQEHCITGDTEISFNLPSGAHYKMKISELYRKFHVGAKPLPNGVVIPLKDRIKNMNIRIYNEETKKIETSNIKDIFHNGVRDVYKVTLECGRNIKCTKSHKFYSNSKFTRLANLKIGDLIATNGVELYKNKDWLLLHKEEGLKLGMGLNYIADKANCSIHTIKKWLLKFEIQYTQIEKSKVRKVWNKGVSGYKLPEWTSEMKSIHRLNTPKGINHHSYKGGGRSERKYIQDYINSKRVDIYNLYGGKAICNKCKSTNCKIELHHIEPVSLNPYKAYDLSNIVPLCVDCHKEAHREISKYRSKYNLDELDWDAIRPSEITTYLGDYTPPFYKSKKGINNKTIKGKSIGYSKIKSIEYIGKENVYDLEVEHSSHNYIANKILVHNSTRYSDRILFEPIELRKEHPTNRQSSTEVFNPLIIKSDIFGQDDMYANTLVEYTLDILESSYKNLIKAGVAKECARHILPGCLTTTMSANGTLRSWLAFLNVRLDHHAEKEIQLIATEIGNILEQELPNVFKQIDWKQGMFM